MLSLSLRNFVSRCRASASHRPWSINASGRTQLTQRLSRPYSAEAGSKLEQDSKEGFRLITVILASAACSAAGFGLARAFDRPPHAISGAPQAGSAKEPSYGTPEDFKTAIAELEATFPSEEYVSTDPGDLHIHGFSTNDYHPGIYSCLQVEG